MYFSGHFQDISVTPRTCDRSVIITIKILKSSFSLGKMSHIKLKDGLLPSYQATTGTETPQPQEAPPKSEPTPYPPQGKLGIYFENFNDPVVVDESIKFSFNNVNNDVVLVNNTSTLSTDTCTCVYILMI